MKIIFSNRWEKLAEALAERLFASSPFAKRIVLVPSDGMREFLLFHLAQKLGIAAGIKICSLERGIGALVSGKKRIPSFIELSLAIEATLEPSDRELSDQLARHFMKYGLYGGRFLSKWLSEEGWQQRLWRTLFSEKSALTYPLEALADKTIDGAGVHLFGFPALADPYLHFFAQSGAHFYHFSVCAEYWEDMCSDREKLAIDRRLMKKGASLLLREEMQGYLEERHLLLANWGKLGRESMKAQGAYDFDGIEWYEPPRTDTLLGALQKSLLHMQAIEMPLESQSIQLHSAASKQHEVEVMQEVLRTLLEKEGIALSDILVFAPDICAYAPYIHAFLKISHTIDGLKSGSLSACAQGFFHLLSLADDELSAQGMLKLLSYAPFCKRFGFCPEDVEVIREWLQKAHVRSGSRSWEEGLDRLLFGFCTEDEPCVTPTQIELLNGFYVCLQSVQRSVEEMRSLSEKTLDAWLDWARMLLLTHFDCDEQEEPLLREIEALHRRALPGVFPFTTLLRVLSHFFDKETGKIDSPQLHKIRCTSLRSGVARKARVIYLLGMDEESFPRQDMPSSLYALPRTFSTKGDEDRYLFLELLGSAQDYFLMSYERNDKAPSRLIDELMSYLKNAPLTVHHRMQVQTTRCSKERAFFSGCAPSREEAPIDLRALRKLARHPLRFYFNERHGIYVKSEEEMDDAFCLSPLEKHALKSLSLKSSLAQATEQGKKSGVLPEGLFQDVALAVLAEEVEEQERCLQALGVQGSDLFSIELSLHCVEAMRRHEGGWVVPAPIVRGVPIVGTLVDVAPQGLLVNAEQNLEGILTAWPHYLLFLSVKDLCGVGSALLFAKGGKKQVWEGEIGAYLEAYIDYYFRALREPSPLMPAWAGRLLKGEKEAFCALADKEPFYADAYVEWMQNSGIRCEASEWYDRWTPYLQENFKWILTF